MYHGCWAAVTALCIEQAFAAFTAAHWDPNTWSAYDEHTMDEVTLINCTSNVSYSL